MRDCLWSGGLSGYEFAVLVGAGDPAGVDVVPMLMWILQVDACFVVGYDSVGPMINDVSNNDSMMAGLGKILWKRI